MPSDATLNVNAWLLRVDLPDQPIYENLLSRGKSAADPEKFTQLKKRVEESFIINIKEFLEEGRYFRGVQLPPEKPMEGDILLNFRFDRYKEESTGHPLSYPFLVLLPLFPIYLFMDGPILIENSDFSAELTVENAQGVQLAVVHSQINVEHTVSLRPRSTLIKDRTWIIKDLIEKGVSQLHKEKRE